MLRKIIVVVVVIVVGFAVVVMLQPAGYTVMRSATINASPADIFALVNDFHRWDAWSPWAKLDPAMKTTYSGSPSGVGAVYAWAGNRDVGEGRMEIIESQPAERLGIKLDFLKPFASSSTTVFAFKPDGNGTAVSWTMSGQNNLMSKAFGVFASMDKMIGPDFEKGLAQLKAAAESARKSASGQ